MELQTKPDFETVLERFEAWWRCELVDRPLLTIDVKRDRPARLPRKDHASPRDRWLDVEFALDRFEAGIDGKVFLAETLPVFTPNLGPDVVGTLFGCELEFVDTATSWSAPAAASCGEVLNLQPDFDGEYWSVIRRMTDRSLERGRGRWLTAPTDLHTNGDLLAALRDPQALCLDFADDLDAVRRALDHLTGFYPAIYDDLHHRIAAAGQPSASWHALHEGRSYPTSCDFICMISPEMFEAAVLGQLAAEMEHLDRTFFHLDGPGALKHMDRLLSLDELDGLQWVHGAGHGLHSDWVDVYRKAQDAGKCVQVFAEDMDVARAIAEQLQPEGTWFWVYGEYSVDEVEAFAEYLHRWAAGKE